MKKSDWIISSATLVYSYLFYNQLAGINFFIFSILLTCMLALLNKDVVKDKIWWLFAALTISTSFFILWHNSNLAIWANICSLLLLSANSVNSRSSVIINGFYSMYSIAASYVFIILNTIKRYENKLEQSASSGKKGINFLLGLAAFVIALIFFFIYKNANPLFEKFTEKINLDFISGAWIVFTIGGFFVMYGFFKHQRIQALDQWENRLPITLADKGLKIKSFEKTSGIFLFVLLNIMLLFINALDVVYLYVLNQLPEGITHTQFVHNGVGMIILSIILGIGIILFLFRNAMNFEEKNKFIKLLVSLWIVQNSMMIISTCVRNYIYVDEFNLTYKRIGVFVYLTLAIIGLLLTLYKIQFKKSNWFLLRTNALCCFIFLCVSSFFNWDRIICTFNIANKSEYLQQLDKKYLLSLSDESIPYLQALKSKKGFETDSAKADGFRNGRGMSSLSGEMYDRETSKKNSEETDIKTYNFLKRTNEYTGWQSWNQRNSNILQQLKNLNEKGSIESITITNQQLDSSELLSVFNHAKIVDLTFCKGNHFDFLKTYGNLTSLLLAGNAVKSMQEIPKLTALARLDLNSNDIKDLTGIDKFTALNNLNLSYTNINNLRPLQNNKELETLSINNCTYLKDLRGIEKLSKLETIYLGDASGIDYFPVFNNLKKLVLNNQTNNINANLGAIPVQPAVEELSIINNNNLRLENLLVTDTRTQTKILRFPVLKKLAANDCAIENSGALASYTNLEVLQLNHNNISNILFLMNAEQLKQLSLAHNHLESIEFTSKHAGLLKLNISNNEYLNDFTNIKELSNLNYLDVSHTRFNNLSLLSCINSLTELNISNCRINSLEILTRFEKLQRLHLTLVNDKDIEMLKKLPALKELFLDADQVSLKDVDKLKKQLPNIKIYR